MLYSFLHHSLHHSLALSIEGVPELLYPSGGPVTNDPIVIIHCMDCTLDNGGSVCHRFSRLKN